MADAAGPREILVVRLSSLGDVVLTTPVFDALRAAWPAARVSVLVRSRYADVLRGQHGVDEVLEFEVGGFWGWFREIRRRRFDLLVDLHDTWRSRAWGLFGAARRTVRYDKRAWARRALVWFKRPRAALAGNVTARYLECLAGAGLTPRAAALSATLQGTGDAARYRPGMSDGAALSGGVDAAAPRLRAAGEGLSGEWEARLGAGPFLGVAPGAQHATKRWPAERFAAAADRLAAALAERDGRRPTTLLFGAPGDRRAAEEVLATLRGPALNLVGRTSVRELMLLARRCVLFLTNDSGAMHVASAGGVPTVAVFGPTVEAFGFYPVAAMAAVVERPGLYCRPCSLHGEPVCPEGHFRCMREITVDQVVSAAERLLALPRETAIPKAVR